MMLSCDAGTACSLVLLQVSTVTAGTKSQGHPTHATPTTPNSTHSTETMATSSQPTRAGRSQAAAEVGMVGGGSKEGMVSTKDVGRDRKKQNNDGNFLINHTSRVTGSSPVSGGNTSAVAEQSAGGGRSTTPAQGQQGQAQRSKAQQEKPFSYAQALKTKSSPFSKPSPEGAMCRASSSKLSSRSQTPSESSLLGGGKEGMMKGALPHSHGSEGNHGSVEDSLDFDLRSSSALSIATATDSVTSEHSVSRQSLPLDISSQRGEEECGMKAAFDTRNERSEIEDSEGITFMGPQLDYDQTSVAERSPLAPPPMITADPSPPTNQFRAPSPAVRAASPINTTITVNHPSATEYANQHTGQKSAPPMSSQQSPSTPKHEDKATTFIERRAPHSPPGLSPNKEHPYKSPGISPQHPSMTGETGAQAQVFKSLQQLEHAPPPRGLEDDETDGGDKNRPPPDQAAAILIPSSQKPSALDGTKEDVHSLMLPLPGGRSLQHQQNVSSGPGGAGVLPSPAMTSILPHPPANSQMGFAATPPQQQAHLPLRPPGQSEKNVHTYFVSFNLKELLHVVAEQIIFYVLCTVYHSSKIWLLELFDMLYGMMGNSF